MRGLACGFLLLAVGALGADAATPKDYAYLYVQGKLGGLGHGRPVGGTTVRLVDGDQAYEAVTDARGFFTFEKLPVATYAVEVRTAQGKVVRRVRQLDTASLGLTLVNLRVGRDRGSSGTGIRVEGESGRVEVVIPEPQTRWPRLWKETLIFVSAAALLGL